MNIDLETIRSRHAIEAIVNEHFPLKKSGSRFIGIEHDSLVVVPRTGFYFWNSKGEHGDVFDFVGRYALKYGDGWNNNNGDHFMDAVRYLADRAGISLEQPANLKQSPAWAERQLVNRLHQALANHKPAIAYVTQERGWHPDTVKTAKIGYMPYLPKDKREILKGLDHLPDMWKQLIERFFPADMIVYPHFANGRLVYLSGRGITAKRHYNPPVDIIGARQPYINSYYKEGGDVVIVEGQADALTFAQWQIPAIALAGMKPSEELLVQLRQHQRVFVALDNTDEAYHQGLKIARTLGGKAYLVELPEDIKDANDWLRAGGTSEDAQKAINHAQSWIMAAVEHTSTLDGLAREDAIRDLFQQATTLDHFQLAQFKDAMADIGIKARTFNELIKAAETFHKTNAKPEDDDAPQIFDDSIPVLSAAQGYNRHIAIMTVTLRERTANNQLANRPYLVTSHREIRRIEDAQVIEIGDQEIALRVLPEGSEMLMRWRYSDIQRFLQGESVDPAAVFHHVHNTFSRYIDFRSRVESSVLALWAIGTYFYTMFPAYPYLVLNGPKNSGKSTVLCILQPMAFNMISTSDPTGPSMFRMIHYTSCTVGIDEAERYHNSRDPGMQQIRQLLNSGYTLNLWHSVLANWNASARHTITR